MRRRHQLILLVLASLAGASPPASADPHLEAKVHRLENGMRVVLQEDHSLPMVAVSVWYGVGSAHEPAGRSGFAHLFEHLMFTGTKRVPGSTFDEILEADGAWSNAGTDTDYTEYHEVGPAHLLPTMLWLEADRMESLGRAVTQEKLDVQRDVVRNERREDYDNAPYGPAEIMLYERMFPDGHPYHDHVIGSHTDLEKATLDDVKAFFARFYVPSNASLAIVGDFEPRPTLALVERLFGSLPSGEALPTARVERPRLEEEHRVVLEDDVRHERLMLAWHSPDFYAPGDAELDLLAAILTDGKSSRLWRRLMHEEAVATEVAAWQESMRHGSLFRLDVTAALGVPRARIEQIVTEELARIRTELVTPAEIDRVRAGLVTEVVAGLQGLLARAEQLNLYTTFLGDPNRLVWDLDRYRNATPASVRETAQRVLDPKRHLTFWVVPRDPSCARDARPKDHARSTFTPTDPDVFRLENGLVVWLVRRPGLPLVAARLVLPGGTQGTPPEAAGLAALAARMLGEGAGARDAMAFSASLAELGTQLEIHYDRSLTYLQIQALAEHLDTAFAHLADAVLRPRWDADDFARLMGRHLTWVGLAVDRPDRLVREVGRRALLSDVAPAYAPAVEGTPTTVPRLSLEALKTHHATRSVPDGAVLILAGDLDPAAARALVERHLGSWKGQHPREATATLPTKLEPGAKRVRRVVLVDRPGAEQTQVRLLLPAPAWEDAERMPMEVLTSVLGGAFTSRLNTVLREEHGYTYGSYARYVPLHGVGFLDLDAAVETGVTGEALDRMLEIVEEIATGDVTDAEAAKAVATLRGERIAPLQRLSGVIDAYTPYAVHDGSPVGFVEDLVALETNATSSAAVLNDLARRRIRPKEGVLVLVGDREAVALQLEGLDLPPPQVLTAQEALELE